MFTREIIISIVLFVSFVVTAAIVVLLEDKYKLIKKIGAVLSCYVIGVILGNFGIFPDTTAAYDAFLHDLGTASIPFDRIKELFAAGEVTRSDVTRNAISFMQDQMATISVLIALPLILFSMDIRKWFSQAKHAMTSLLIGLFTVLLMIFIGYFLFRGGLDRAGDIGGLLVGVYTGGTPNMAAIKTALEIPNEIYIMTHTYEMFLGAIYLIFIFSIGQRTFELFLPKYKAPKKDSTIDVKEMELEKNLQEDYESYEGFFRKSNILPLLAALGLSILILGVSFGLGQLFPNSYMNTVVVLSLTALAIGASFIPKVKQIRKTFQLGMFIILIFCISVASMADVRKLADISLNLFYFVGVAMFGSHLLHAFIARFFKIDADTVIISGSALICSPPFVPVVAASLKNRDVIMTGLAVGIAGYAVGNFLGVFVAEILNSGILG